MSVTVDRQQPAIAPALCASPQSDTEFEKLWAMTAAQRIAAMWKRELSLAQLSEWTKKNPNEVPTLGGEFAWIVQLMPEWCEPSRPATGTSR
jgi:hypothetical protein